MNDTTDWITPVEFALRVGGRKHPDNVRRELESGELHGHQKKKGARWRIHPDAVEVYVRGGDTRQPCGCANVTTLRQRKTA